MTQLVCRLVSLSEKDCFHWVLLGRQSIRTGRGRDDRRRHRHTRIRRARRRSGRQPAARGGQLFGSSSTSAPGSCGGIGQPQRQPLERLARGRIRHIEAVDVPCAVQDRQGLARRVEVRPLVARRVGHIAQLLVVPVPGAANEVEGVSVISRPQHMLAPTYDSAIPETWRAGGQADSIRRMQRKPMWLVAVSTA
jgi:hypothetical protein